VGTRRAEKRLNAPVKSAEPKVELRETVYSRTERTQEKRCLVSKLVKNVPFVVDDVVGIRTEAKPCS